MKRVVVISDDDEDEDEHIGGGGSSRAGRSSSSRSRSEAAASSGHKRPRCPNSKKAQTTSWRRPPTRPNWDDEVKFGSLSEEFSECLQGFATSPAENRSSESRSRNVGSNELWVDKYKPRASNELVVHKKKVEEIRNWLEERIKCRKEQPGSNVLMITGQAGVGKSATIEVLASQLGAELCEWTTPTPTLWQEHMHISYSGTKYTSKLEEFETFVEQTMKYQLLSSSNIGHRKPLIVLIDDLPVANGNIAYGRLSKCLYHLVQSAQVPTVILVTELPKDEIGDRTSIYWEGLEASFLRAGVCKVTLNPVTINSIKKALLRICREENCKISEESISLIAKASTGDIRHAITSLQYFCLGRNVPRLSPLSVASPRNSMEIDCNGRLSLLMDQTDYPLHSNSSFSLGRDENISLFHALGKFLHNKRESADAFGNNPFILQEKFTRNPLKLGDPENVIMQAHGQARSIIDFLHENVIDFLRSEAMDDTWVVASYLSDADHLLGTLSRRVRSRMIIDEYSLEQIPQLAATSVAVRGVLFGNSQPSSTGWHSIRSPRLWQVENSSRFNKGRMAMERFEAYSSLSLCSVADLATEYKPAVRVLGFRSLEDNSNGDPSSDTSLTHNSGGSDGDEIEDWE